FRSRHCRLECGNPCLVVGERRRRGLIGLRQCGDFIAAVVVSDEIQRQYQCQNNGDYHAGDEQGVAVDLRAALGGGHGCGDSHIPTSSFRLSAAHPTVPFEPQVTNTHQLR
ncbi:MAG: hypothetical protein PHV43_03450, partial [Candidatus Colwellbacteria bacterium]|nr:hypothetical protein [Candidatus Colwellbacteria bacterium]